MPSLYIITVQWPGCVPESWHLHYSEVWGECKGLIAQKPIGVWVRPV